MTLQSWKIPLTVKYSLVQFLCTVTLFLEVLLADAPTKCMTTVDKKNASKGCRITDVRMIDTDLDLIPDDLDRNGFKYPKKIIGPHFSIEQLVNSYISIAPNQRRDESGHSASEKTNIRRTH